MKIQFRWLSAVLVAVFFFCLFPNGSISGHQIRLTVKNNNQLTKTARNTPNPDPHGVHQLRGYV